MLGHWTSSKNLKVEIYLQLCNIVRTLITNTVCFSEFQPFLFLPRNETHKARRYFLGIFADFCEKEVGKRIGF